MPDDRFHAGAPNTREPGALISDLLGDFNELVQKEIALAKGEIQENLSNKISGAVWIAIGGVILLLGAIVALAGLVLFVGTFGIPLHWSAFAVAAGVIVIGLIVAMSGKSKLEGDLMPTRSIRQVGEDIKTVKEQMQ